MFALLKPYKAQVLLLALIGLIANGLNLLIPELIGDGINSITIVHGLEERLLVRFAAVILAVLVLATLQNLIQVHAGEQVAFDLRKRLSEKLSRQSYAFLVAHDRSRLLTNLTSDVDAVKVFVSQVIAGLISSAVVITGASILLLRLNTRVGLAVLMIVPLVGVTFYVVLKSVRPLFKEGRILIDSLNRVIEENVVGAALIRVLNVGQKEEEKFSKINQKARELGLKILAHFTFMSPAATFFSNVATLIILTLGGWQVLGGQMRVGDIAAFNSYLALLIFPIFVIGFMGNLISSAQASYVRIEAVLNAPEPKLVAKSGQPLGGGLQARELFLSYGEKDVLKGISFSLKPATRTAIVGPTAAGKTQLIHLLSGLLEPSRGEILYDDSLSPQMLGHQIGVVFQESALFYASLRDNIVMNAAVKEDGLARAIETAELKDFVQSLPEGLDTLVSERGTTLSGGQKQRVMLARALALEPQVLLLDDFTARLDPTTEAKVHLNLEQNYPGLTILTVTQRISSVVDFDHIMLVMEGQLIAQGTHHELLEQSPEYMQIFESQKSIQQYA